MYNVGRSSSAVSGSTKGSAINAGALFPSMNELREDALSKK